MANKGIYVWALSLTLGTLSSYAFSQDEEQWYDGRFSVGAALGLAIADVDALDDTDDELYLELFGRYKLNSGFAVDASLVSLGNHENDDVYQTEVEAQAFAVQLGYFCSVSERVSLYGRAGIHFWQAEAYRIEGVINTSTQKLDFPQQKVYDNDGVDMTAGLGVDFHLNPNFAIGANYQHYRMDHGNADTVGVTGAYTF